MDLPSGTVTFLFTDIEGSTRLWEQHPEAMDGALAQHNAIVQEALGAHDGHVFKTVGDAFCCVFANATDAVAAALTAQQALHREAWPDHLQLRVRMALHTGPAQERDGDYLGAPLNRVARLLACAHGGQMLLSRATYELVQEHAPEGVSFQDLGEHSLRDLSHPEHIFQLCHADLPADFPALRSLQAFAHNLPLQLTSFIGREREIEEIKQLLAETRLLTLTGVGGAGKTRLALQVGAEVLDEYGDGVWLTELAALADPGLVPQTVASALGVREQPAQAILETLTEHLRSKSCLLILDNCEHVLDASARLADEVLRGCPELKILASSREGLGIAGETTYHVPSLSLPDPDEAPTPERITECAAVGLFTDRAQSHQRGFSVTDANAEAVVQVCRRLDGIPLAIELAAARVRAMPVEQIAERLDDRFRLLTGGSRTALARQQTLQALIDWSYDLLDEKERVLLRRLSVFAGGWTLEAAEAVCSGDGIEDREVLDLLTSLVDKSVAVYEEHDGQARYRLLETVRQYARQRLLDSGEAPTVHEGHSAFFLAVAVEAAPRLHGPEQKHWLDRLDVEHDNLRAALERYQGREDMAREALRLASALHDFWNLRGHLSEGRGCLEEALARSDATDRTALRAGAVYGAAALALQQGDYDAARAFYEEALAIRRELGDTRGVAGCLNNLGVVAKRRGDYAAAQPLFGEALAVNRDIGNRHWEAINLNNLGDVATQQGDYVAARALLEEGLAIQRELVDRTGVARCLNNLGTVARREGDYAAARALHQESLAIWSELQEKWRVALCLAQLAAVSGAEGDAAAAGRLFAAAEAQREAVGAVFPRHERDEHDRSITAAREALGEEAFEAAWAQGRAMTMEEAIEYALGH